MQKDLKTYGKKFQLFKEIIDEITWKTALQDKGGEEILELLNNIFCTTQELPNPMYKKSAMDGRKWAWLPPWPNRNTRGKCGGSGTTDMCPWKNIVILFEGIVWGCLRDQENQGTNRDILGKGCEL